MGLDLVQGSIRFLCRGDDSAIKCSTVSKESTRHCVLNNIVIRNTQYGIAFYVKDGGSYEDIQFSNINIETTWLVETDKDRRNSFPLFVDVESRNAQTALGTTCNMFPTLFFFLLALVPSWSQYLKCLKNDIFATRDLYDKITIIRIYPLVM